MKISFLKLKFAVDPLGIGYLSSSLKNAGHETILILVDNKDYMDKIKNFCPDILAYSISTGEHKYYLDLNRKIKAMYPNMISIFGGPHPTFFPEMVKEDGVDFVVQGEAETSFVDLVDRIENLGLPIKDRYEQLIKPEELEQDLDKIAFPDRELIYSYPENRDNPIKNVMLSRGCPFSCSYCHNGIYKELYKGQKTLRYRSVDNVIEECYQLKTNYPQTKFIFFQDDEFLANTKILNEFCIAYTRRIGLPLHCQVRAELMTDEKAYLLKNAGCVSITFAIESGNDNIRRNMLNRKVSKEQILRCCGILKKYGLSYRTENMIGLPGETLDEALETLDLNIKCSPDISWCSIFQPYPKTKLGDMCKEMLLYSGDIDEIGNDFFGYSVLKRDTVREFNNLQKIWGFVVAFPVLRPFVKILIKMPELKLLNKLSIKFKQLMYDTKLYKVK